MRSLLGAIRSWLHRFAPGFHPSRATPVRKALAAWVGWRRPSVLSTRHGFDLYVPPDDRSPIVVSLYLTGEYEPEETRAIQRLLQAGDVAVDVGANVGYMTCVMAQAVGAHGAVHAFEPEARHFAALRRNVEGNRMSQVLCHRRALSSAAGEAALFLDPENPGDHTLVPIPGRDSVSVETFSFDDYWRRISHSRPIRLVKIDVQGHELEVLHGMSDTLRDGSIEGLLLEVWPYRLRRAGASSDDLLAILAGLGWPARILSTTGADVHDSLAAVRAAAREHGEDPTLAFNVLLERPPRASA